MKKILPVVVLVLTTSVQAQDERDYGDLVPEEHFEITQNKTRLKDNANISHYEIKVKPEREDFIYKDISVRTPRKKNFKLRVDRDQGKITQITSVSYDSEEKGSGGMSLVSGKVLPSGHLKSLTHCYETYNFGWFSRQKNKSGVECVTVNKEVCDYFSKNQIDEALISQLSSCSETMKKLSDQQGDIFKLIKADATNNLSSIRDLDGKIKGLKNLYEVEPKTLAGLSEVVIGYGKALSQCAFMKEKAYFAPDEKPVSSSEESNQDEATTQQ